MEDIMIIRKEELKDKEEIYNLVKEAFKNAEHSDGQEHNLVNKLRNSESFIPELSLVAEDNEKIAAHIMYTKVHIVNGEEKYESLALVQLKELAKVRGLKGTSTMKKADLVEAMLAEDERLKKEEEAKLTPESVPSIRITWHTMRASIPRNWTAVSKPAVS